MFSRFKKKLTEIKTDLNYKIDQLEVDKNHIFNKTQRLIDSDLTQNGTNFLLKKEEYLNKIEEISRDIENDSLQFEKEVKEKALVYTTNLFYTLRTLEKELNLVLKSVDTFKTTIEKCELFCLKLNKDLFYLENIYQDLEYEKLKNNQQSIIDKCLTEEENLVIKDQEVKLSITFD